MISPPPTLVRAAATAAVALLLASSVGAQPPSRLAPAHPDSLIQPLEIDGLVLDETQTPIGRDYFDVFRSLWRPPEGAYNYSVRVAEQPSPSRGTRVVVLVNEEVVFQSNVTPGEEVVFETARAGAVEAYRWLARSSTRPTYY